MQRLLILTLLASLATLPSLSAPQSSAHPAPTLDQQVNSLAFLSGRWIDSSPDGDQEEYWSQPMGASMVGHFRVVKAGNAVFYEFWAIEVDDGKLVFKMKHFNRGLIGWEEKAEIVRLDTSIAATQDVVFSKPDGSLTLRYTRKGDELTSILRRVKDGKVKEDVFHLHLSR